MKAILAVFIQFFKGEMRDKYSLFWNLAFPLALLTILILVFSNMGNVDGSIELNIGLVNHDRVTSEDENFSQIIVDVLTNISEDDESWLNLSFVGDEPQQELENELENLDRGLRHAVVVIPDSFNQEVYQEIMAQHTTFIEAQGPTDIVVYSRPGNQMSDIAVDIVSQIVSDINKEINIRAGLVQDESAVELRYLETATANDMDRSFDFAEYLLPGIILMAFLGSGLEVVVERLTSYRERGILRRYFATPLQPFQYSLGLLLHIAILSIIQVALIYFFAVHFFAVDIQLFNPVPLFFLVFSLVTILSLGWFVSAVSKTANAANILTNALIYPLMFLGGLYFPVMNLPYPIRLFVIANPITYLANGLRDSLGVFASPTSPVLNIVIPAMWLMCTLIYGFKNFSWDIKEGK